LTPQPPERPVTAGSRPRPKKTHQPRFPANSHPQLLRTSSFRQFEFVPSNIGIACRLLRTLAKEHAAPVSARTASQIRPKFPVELNRFGVIGAERLA
jgi:hypothetical protein